MSAKWLTEIRELKDDNWFVDNPNGRDVNEQISALLSTIEELKKALEFECDGTCARGINPCNAREVLDKLETGSL